MAYDSLKNIIRQYIKTNGEQEITGQIMQNVLIEMVNNYPILDGYATQAWVNQQGYVTSSALAGYLPLTGGTLTGNLGMVEGTNIDITLAESSRRGVYLTLGMHTVDSTDYCLSLQYSPSLTPLKAGIDIDGNMYGEHFIVSGGTSSQFLKADGSVDSSAYITSSALAGYLPLTGGTLTGNLGMTTGTNIDITLAESSRRGVYLTLGMHTVDSTDYCLSLQYSQSSTPLKAGIDIDGNMYGEHFIVNGGTSSQFLKADGSVDSNTYITSAALAGYLPLSGGTMTGNLIINRTNDESALILRGRTGSEEFWVGVSDSFYIWTETHKSYIRCKGGKVGIITGDPAYQLDVNGSANATTLYENGTSLSNKYLALTGGTLTGDLTIRNGYLELYRTDTGFVAGIYYGSSGMEFDEEHYSMFRFSGDVYAESFNQTSDLRKKTITGNVQMNLYNVANAPLFKFTWKDEKKYSGQHVGSAAQYWQTVLPELVSIGSDIEQTLAMQYDVIALASVITVAKTVVDHERRIVILERENEELRKELAALKSA